MKHKKDKAFSSKKKDVIFFDFFIFLSFHLIEDDIEIEKYKTSVELKRLGFLHFLLNIKRIIELCLNTCIMP